ncbi:WYL domain-containing protein [Kineosporia sp. NBRC 101731]|uniref:helix-turn-helix transcriptional regulator n=1 Tax=Kineosporia sp. NBRC 101731 TaxID=3032199 RepID=UPI0024A428A1|nr:WYL domain-containing protein [Kineosporia sp. NBRC 101731]GLY28178.1 DeoR family transcriptional regulator [Kineosporia sp. NBRC 101731]
MSGTSERLLSLLSLLQARRDWPGPVLAERLEVSPRTVRRDVDRLRELGYPIAAFKGPDGGYRLEAGADLPPLLFDDEQAVALAVALRLATVSGAGVSEAAGRALATVRQVMPSRLRHRIDALEVTAVGSPVDADPQVLMALAEAVRARETVRFDYGTDHDRPPRRAQPHHLVSRHGRWYLLAWDTDKNDWRTFRADRMSLRTPGGPRFTRREIPGGDPATFVTGLFRGSREGDPQWPCQGSVVLNIDASTLAPHIGDGTLEPLGPGTCRLTLGSWSWAGLAASIARFDADFEVEGPPELLAAVDALGRRFGAASAGGRES